MAINPGPDEEELMYGRRGQAGNGGCMFPFVIIIGGMLGGMIGIEKILILFV